MKILNKIDNVTLSPTTGNRTIADNGNELFKWIDPDFRYWSANEKGGKTKNTEVAIFEMRKSATFKEMYAELGDAEDLVFTQDQVLEFVENHPDKLHPFWGTFFLFRSGGKLFVALVYRDDGGSLSVRVRRFSDDDAWLGGGRRRVPVPVLGLSAPSEKGTSDAQDLGPSDRERAREFLEAIDEQVAQLRELLS